MARSIWTGTLSFGLVSVPVALYSATDEHGVRFNQFEAGTTDRIRYRRVNERTGEEVDYANITKGVEVSPGEYVILDPKEIETIEQGGTERSIEVSDFVELKDIDPVCFQKSYYLAPHGKTAPKPYALLHATMVAEGKVAIAHFTMRGKQHLCAVRPTEDVLMLETLYYADEVRKPTEEIDTLPVEIEVNEKELAAAKMLLETMTTDWFPAAYHDSYAETLQELIEAKRSDAVITLDSKKPEATKAVDLIDALRASVAQVEANRAAAGNAPAADEKAAAKKTSKTVAHKAPAKKASSRKAS